MFIVLDIVAYLAIGAFLIYLVERYDGTLGGNGEYGLIFVVYLFWPIVFTLYFPVFIAETGRKHRKKSRQ